MVGKTWLAAFFVLIAGPAAALAEGSAEIGVSQHAQGITVMHVDILAAGEAISWLAGDGVIRVTSPSGTFTELALGESLTTTEVGAHTVRFSQSQTGAWDIDVRLPGAALASLGRLFSTRWQLNTGSFDEDAAANGSYYALVPGGGEGQTGVIELALRGLSGFSYRIGANSTGVAGTRAGRSVLVSGNSFAPEYAMYLNPPAVANFQSTAPVVTNFSYSSGAQSCDWIAPGGSEGVFSFGSNVTGTYHLICDANGDGSFNRVDNEDVLLVGVASPGVNTVTWNGRDNSGVPVAIGQHLCQVSLNVGELHYVGEDIETSYQGLRLFAVSGDSSRTGLPMFWNDAAVQNWVVAMPDSTLGLEDSGADGLSSGFYEDAPNPNVNARSWGNFSSNTKGNDTLLDTFAHLDFALSGLVAIEAVDEADDCDGDGLSDVWEHCELGTAVCSCDIADGDSRDTDGDGVCDGPIGFANLCVAGPDVAPLDPSVCADMDEDGCEDCSSGSFDPFADGADEDSDGVCDLAEDFDGDGVIDVLDLDDDNDGIVDDMEELLGGRHDLDSDGDGIFDLVEAGHGGLDANADGVLDCPEGVGDNGLCNALESSSGCGYVDYDGDGAGPDLPRDTDGDGLFDFEDLDSDNDVASDFAETAWDTDGDGVENFRDLDADNDGVPDSWEVGSGCLDADDNAVCDGPVPQPTDSPADSNGDGLADYLDPSGSASGCVGEPICEGADSDGDGIVDPEDGYDGFGRAPQSDGGYGDGGYGDGGYGDDYGGYGDGGYGDNYEGGYGNYGGYDYGKRADDPAFDRGASPASLGAYGAYPPGCSASGGSTPWFALMVLLILLGLQNTRSRRKKREIYE